MSPLAAVLLVLILGTALTLASSRATTSVRDGRTFLRWMMVVFAAYLALIALPVVAAF